jgi:hypothetical protein
VPRLGSGFHNLTLSDRYRIARRKCLTLSADSRLVCQPEVTSVQGIEIRGLLGFSHRRGNTSSRPRNSLRNSFIFAAVGDAIVMSATPLACGAPKCTAWACSSTRSRSAISERSVSSAFKRRFSSPICRAMSSEVSIELFPLNRAKQRLLHDTISLWLRYSLACKSLRLSTNTAIDQRARDPNGASVLSRSKYSVSTRRCGDALKKRRRS